MDRAETLIEVELVYSPAARSVERLTLAVPAGSTLGQALLGSGVAVRLGLGSELCFGVWGRRAGPDTVLRAGDRVEVYRGLLVDPKEARRLRFRKQGAKAGGKKRAPK
jgi:uncharacterized protein